MVWGKLKQGDKLGSNCIGSGEMMAFWIRVVSGVTERSE